MVKLSKKMVVTLGASGVLALGIAAPVAAWAADGTPKPTGSASTTESGKPQPREHGKSDVDRTAKLKERLDAAVKAGKLTQAEADAVLKAAKLGLLGGGPGRPHGTPPSGAPSAPAK
ncbi:MAG: hypothetical protein HOU81_07870 [Hamadaea sp.]|uniref:hypothetical protein n=1 Tax=Hamadaea sp. TaxID=2024425 RepID=UPI00183F3BAC|nr:hypothetical protein [Hamadaea sp.]NUR70724.1 hypothetical protein [Hamadaea sp.]NUT21410.1 hypothetical protein [Hamadaea sp.]